MKQFKIYFCTLLLICFSSQVVFGLENLGRGFVGYRTTEGTTKYICLSWRFLSADDPDTQYNIYMARVNPTTGELATEYSKLNEEPISNTSFFRYAEKNLVPLRYQLREVNGGIEGETVAEYQVKKSTEVSDNYIQIPMKQVSGDTSWKYAPNDASVADLDGDGELEIVIHRAGTGHDNANSGVTDPPVLQAYKLDGTFMWEINLGVNIREGAHYTQFMVYDLDGDGKAEVVCKTAEGSKDAAGTWVGEAYYPTYKRKYSLASSFNPNAVYRNSGGYILQGPEFLTVFDGETGTEIVTTEYDPPRFSSSITNGNEIPVMNPTKDQLNSRWGDNYGNRVDRFLACVAYLGGDNHSVVMCRGYYTRTVLVAYDYKDKTLTRRWKFDTWNNSAYGSYTGQGNHNLRVGDVDGDGFDEIVYGSCTIDHDGKGLYNTKLGHGDAMHMTDFIPSRPGMEVLACHENGVDGTTLRDASTGEVIYRIPSGDDVGRCMGADVDPRYRGMEWWSSRRAISNSVDGEVVGNSDISMNMACWWDGDLLREMQSGTSVTKNNVAARTKETLFTASDCSSNNSTKDNPCLQADIIGDWREEVMLRTSDNRYLRIYMTPYPTDYRFHTFMEDNVYRMSVAYQNVAYNQPTGTSFYIGPDLEDIFPEDVEIIGDSYEVDPYFEALSYNWSNGLSTKTIVLNRSDYEPDVKNQIALEMNFRGHVFSDVLNFTFKSPSSLDNALVQDGIRLLKNPVGEFVELQSGLEGKLQVQITSVSGMVYMNDMLPFNYGEIKHIAVNHLTPGVYTLNLTNGTQSFRFKFVKI